MATGTSAAESRAFTVDSAADTIDAVPGDGSCAETSGSCSLRAAIQESNAGNGPATIILPAGVYEIGLGGCCDNQSEFGDFDITGDLSLVGAGPEVTHVSVSDTIITDRVLDVRPGAVVAISGITIGDVFMPSPLPGDENCGGGIRNSGNLTISSSTIRGNTFRGSGAGICNTSIVRIQDSILEHNTAAFAGVGGGMLNSASGMATLLRVAVHSNTADTVGGGGIANLGRMSISDSTVNNNFATAGPYRGAGGITNGATGISNAFIEIVNTSISGNSTDGVFGGGGLSNRKESVALVVNSTVSGNVSLDDEGGGVSTEIGGSTTFINTIVAQNQNGDCRPPDDESLAPMSGGNNLDSDGTCGLDGPGDISGVDPLLGALVDNGGPTETHALLAGSPAINAGDSDQCPETDQRGAPRDDECDIGAYEADAVVPTPGPSPRGDLDCDGVVTLVDALYALGSAADAVGLPQCASATGDADCDGDIDAVDGLLIVKQVADLPVEVCVPT